MGSAMTRSAARSRATVDLLMKNQYTRQLQGCPEILECLERYLRIKGLAKDYAEKSEYYCFMYKFPIERVIFDGQDDLIVEEKQLHLLNHQFFRNALIFL